MCLQITLFYVYLLRFTVGLKGHTSYAELLPSREFYDFLLFKFIASSSYSKYCWLTYFRPLQDVDTGVSYTEVIEVEVVNC